MENETHLFRKCDNSFPKSLTTSTSVGHPSSNSIQVSGVVVGVGGESDTSGRSRGNGGKTSTSRNIKDCEEEEEEEETTDEDEAFSKSRSRTFLRIPIPLPIPMSINNSSKSYSNPTTTTVLTPVPKQKQSHQKSKKSKHANLLVRRRSSLSAELEGRSSGATTNSSLDKFIYNNDSPLGSHEDSDEHLFHRARHNRDRDRDRDRNDRDREGDRYEKIKTKTKPHLNPMAMTSTMTHKYNQDFQDANGARGNVSSLSTHHNVHSSMSLLSMSTNNAITIAPSRNSYLEPNVFDTTGGRYPHHNKRHNHHGHGGRRTRSKTPELLSLSRNSIANSNNGGGGSNNKPADLQSVLNRLDFRIRNNFGDWSNMDDDTNFEYRSVGRIPGGGGGVGGGGGGGTMNNLTSHFRPAVDDGSSKILNGSVSLPPLYKNYQTVLHSSKSKLLDKSQRIAMSKDNNDPNSILSEAKRTLMKMGDGGGGKVDI